MSIIYKRLRSIGSQFTGECSNFNLSLPLYLLKINIENELNDALPFDGDLASMRTFKSNQKCINTIQKQVIMNINNQDTFLQLYYARIYIILGKSFQ